MSDNSEAPAAPVAPGVSPYVTLAFEGIPLVTFPNNAVQEAAMGTLLAACAVRALARLPGGREALEQQFEKIGVRVQFPEDLAPAAKEE